MTEIEDKPQPLMEHLIELRQRLERDAVERPRLTAIGAEGFGDEGE